ncbi:hypothetical protein QQF64_033380 [Cirrhinus molitorella]|uniref:Uncharacterized protein n=1 Tax=Cirrhinus molitorella TaxID=172907 RepID=A0ABR3MTQ6_9TELE
MSECERRGNSSIENVCLRERESEHVCVSDHINHFSAAAARSPIYPKISLLKSPSDIIWLFTEFSGGRANTAGHVMDMGCQGGLSSREQNQRPSARSGIAVLTINMRTAKQP